MSAKPFAVVEFIEEGSVGIVHESWIETNPKTKTIYCYWPKGQPNLSVSKRVRKGEIPDKVNWSKQEIRIFCYAGTFSDALLRSRKAEETSNVETEEEQEESGKRKRKAPRAFSSSDSESSPPRRRSPRKTLIYNNETCRPSLPKAPKLTKSDTKQTNRPSLPKAPFSANLTKDNHACSDSSSDNGDDDNDVDDFRHRRHSTPIQPSGLRSPPVPTTPINNPGQDAEGVNRSLGQSSSVSGGVLKLILTKLNILQQNQNEILRTVRNLAERHVPENLTVSEVDEICPKPAETNEELLDLNEKVKGEEMRKKLSQYYCTFGGKDVDTTCRLIMSFTGSNKVWSLYSLKGMRGKKKLEDLAICRPILNALMKTHKTTKKEAEDAVTEFLKHAPFKKGGLKFKKGVVGASSGDQEDLQAQEDFEV